MHFVRVQHDGMCAMIAAPPSIPQQLDLVVFVIATRGTQRKVEELVAIGALPRH